jgi:Family of unknown function (DUF6152)
MRAVTVFVTAGVLLAVGALMVSALPAQAHHSFAAYDMRSSRTVEGVLQEFRWGAPHSSMVITYQDANGASARMSIVSGSPLMFSRQGFRPRDFRAGSRVRVVYHPNVNGAAGGALVSLRLPDGRTFSDEEAERAAGPRPG